MVGDFKKLRFSIRKLSIGAVSLSVGLSLVQPTILNHNIVMASSASAETGLQGTVSTEQELQDKINNNAQDIVLSANIDITKTITIPNTFTGKIHGNGFTLKLVTQNINMFEIEGSTVTFDSIVLDGNDIGRPLDIGKQANVTLTKSTIQKGHTGNLNNGGAVYISGSKLKLDNTTIQDSKAVKKAGTADDIRPNGGAIYAYGAEITLENKSEILNNTLEGGDGNGGGIYATSDSKVKISDSTFTGNHTFKITDLANEGGAVFVNGGTTLEVSDSTFNVAKGFNTGGAIAMRHAKAEIKNSKFDINNLGDAYGISGGAIMSGESDLKVDGSTFTATNSKVTFSGGFINIVTGGSFTLTNSTLTGAGSWWNGPSISTFGGAIGFETGSTATATIENTTIKDVTADETGGAISLATKINEEASVNLTLRNTNIINTRTKFAWKDTRGGAIHVGKGNTLRIDGGSIKDSFSVKGGAIYNDGTVELGGAETEISGNTAYKYGGGIYNNETPKRQVGYLVAKGDGTYTPTKEDADFLHYFTKDTVGVSDYADHDSLAKWDYVLNPENNTVVLGQRVKVVYDANADNAKFADGNKTIEEVLTVYKPDFAPQETTQVPTRDGYRFKGWYTTSDNQNDKFTLSKDSFGITGNEITTPIAKESVTAYAAWEKEQKVTYEFKSATAGKDLPQEVKDLLPTDDGKYKKDDQVTAKQPTSTEVADAAQDGKWEYKANPVAKYTVGYKFESATAGKDLPQAVKDLLPTDANEYVNGVQVDAKQPAKAEVEVADGKWVFKGYAANQQTVNGSNVEFVGKWAFVAKPVAKYKVTYEFTSTDTANALPAEVLALLPTDANEHVDNDVVTAVQPAQTEVTVANGKWTFNGYGATSPQTVNGSDVKFIGTWTFTPKPVTKYKATYEFVSADATKALPKEVLAYLPTDANDYEDNTSVTATEPTVKSYKDTKLDGTWVFTNYDAPTKTINKAGVKFVGTWKFVANKYTVNYTFESDTAGKVLPNEVTNLLPTDANEYVTNDAVTAKQPAQNTVTVKNGVWKFKGYAANSQTVNGSNVEFVGKWEFEAKQETKYTVDYAFASSTAGKQLPGEVLALIPTDSNEYTNGQEVIAKDPAKTSVDVQDGTWTFDGYQQNKFTVNNANVTFQGTWTFTAKQTPPVTKYKATYEFTSADTTKALPAEVLALLPTDANEHVDNDVVTAVQPAQTEVTVANGKWTFNGYGATSPQTVNGSDVKFIGTWTFTPKPVTKYKATYEFVSADATKALPKEVLAYLPTDANDYEDNTSVTATEPTVKSYKDTKLDGTWVFTNYDAPTKTINKAGVKFVGTWKFVANKYTVNYTFESDTAGKVLPNEVTNLLPTDANEYVTNDAVTAKQPAQNTVTVKNGVWKFKGYAANSQTVNGSNVEFVGKWEFEAKQETKYTVDYAFASSTAGKQLPGEVLALIPTDSNEYTNGQEVIAKDPAKTSVDVQDGTWTFDGYQQNKFTVNNANVTFQGTWTFTAKQTPPVTKYKATYEFTSADTTKALPAEVLALLPTDANEYVDNDVVTAVQPAQTEVTVADGKWTFNGYAANSQTVNGSDVKFSGTWTFTANPATKYTATYEFASADATKALPAEVLALLPTDANEYVDNDVVTAIQPAQTEVTVADGKWTFNGYDAATKTVNGAGVKFSGTWTFTAKPTPPVIEKKGGENGEAWVQPELPEFQGGVNGEGLVQPELPEFKFENKEEDKDKGRETDQSAPEEGKLPNTGQTTTNAGIAGLALAGLALAAMRRRKNK